jgi:hypothetical protein
VIKQQGGPNSANVQAQVVHVGLTYTEAKDLYNCLAERSLVELESRARETANSRIEEFRNEFLDLLFGESPNLSVALEEPDVQYALLTAQRDYARCGGDELRHALIRLLLKKCASEPRSLQAIILAEAIETARKIPRKGLNSLVVAFLVNWVKLGGSLDLESLTEWYSANVRTLVSDSATDALSYEHLVYSGCADFNPVKRDAESILIDTYPGLFQNGYPPGYWDADTLDAYQQRGYLRKAVRNSGYYEVNATDEDAVRAMASTDEEAARLSEMMLRSRVSPKNAAVELSNLSDSWRVILDAWRSTPLWQIRLTSVGKALAHSHWMTQRSDSEEGGEMEIWIPNE